MPDDFKALYEAEKKKVVALQEKIKMFEQNGRAKLYYALNRKMNEMADRLNGTNLVSINLEDAKDKTFDRLKVIWKDAAEIAVAVKALGESVGATGNETKDVARKPFLEQIAEIRQ